MGRKVVYFGGGGSASGDGDGIKRGVRNGLKFLAAAFVLSMILGMLRQCHHEHEGQTEATPWDTIPEISDTTGFKPTEPIEATPVLPPVEDPNYKDPGENLPNAGDNRMPSDTTGLIDDPDKGKIYSNQLTVIIDEEDKTRDVVKQWADEFKALFPGEGYKVTFYDKNLKILHLVVPPEDRENVKATVKAKITDIKFYITDNRSFVTEGERVVPQDELFTKAGVPELYRWYFEPIQAYEAWGITRGTGDVTVAIVDSYFDLKHAELSGSRVTAPFSVEKWSRDVEPDAQMDRTNPNFYHGTVVASIALATADNGTGGSGIAPKCRFMPISVGSHIQTLQILYGMLYAVNNGADVINLSLGVDFGAKEHGASIGEQIEASKLIGQEEEEIWEYIYNLSEKRKCTIVYAAGNSTEYIGLDPSKRSRNILNVSSVNYDLKASDFTNVGNYEEHGVHTSTISAPGELMFAAKPFNSYITDPKELHESAGTSYSAPIVTGAVALMKSMDNSLTTREIIKILDETGKPVGGTNGSHIGKLIQIKDALQKVKEGIAQGDDFRKKPMGLWGSVKQVKYYVVSTGLYSGQGRPYFEIKSEKEGKAHIYCVTEDKKGIGDDCTAAMTVKIVDGEVVVGSTGEIKGTGKSRPYLGIKSGKIYSDESGVVHFKGVTGDRNYSMYDSECDYVLKRFDKIMEETEPEYNGENE